MWICVRACQICRKEADEGVVMAWLKQRRSRGDGGWGNFPGDQPHMGWTNLAVDTIRAVGEEIPDREGVVKWIFRCQNKDGGFGYAPNSSLSDLWYTYLAVQVLDWVGFELEGRSDIRNYVMSCRKADGGFGDNPGWPSRVSPTMWASEVLDLLGGFPATQDVSVVGDENYDGLEVFTTLLSVGGDKESIFDSPADLVNVAHISGLHVIGTKNPSLNYLKRAAEYARFQGWNISVLRGAEEYANRIRLPGFYWRGSPYEFDHISLWFGLNDSAEDWGPSSSVFPSFDAFRIFKLRIIRKNGGFSYLEPYSDEPEYLKIILDQSVARSDGYDFVDVGRLRSNPWLEKYAISGRILPLVQADQHKDCWWEAQKLNQKRLLYIAKNASWKGFVDAARNGRVCVAFRGDVLGPKDAVQYASSRIDEWKWWDFPEKPKALPSVMCFPITQSLAQEWDQPFDGAILKIRNTTRVLKVMIDGCAARISKRSSQIWGMGPVMYVQIPEKQLLLLNSHNVLIEFSLRGTQQLAIEFDNSGRVTGLRWTVPEALSACLSLGLPILLLRPHTL